MKNKYLLVFYITTIILAIYAFYLIGIWYFENQNNKTIQEDIIKNTYIEEKNDKFPYITTDLKMLMGENNETVGWLNVPNTNINYPVVKHTNNDFYLNHNFKKEDNSAGWIFMDSRNNPNDLDHNTIIYGHNRLDGSMFGSLKNVLEPSWYENVNNKYIYFNNEKYSLTYQVFSIYRIHKNDFLAKINFKSNEEFTEYLNDIINKSIYNYNISVTYNDNIITLYTCNSLNDYRTILHAKLIQEKKN